MAKNRDWKYVEPKPKSKKPEEKKGCVLYARVSTSKQEGIEGQLIRCRKEAAEQGLQILKEFIAEAEHGDAQERESLDELLQFCWANQDEIGTIIVSDFSRAARNLLVFTKLVAQLKLMGIRIVDATLGQSTDSLIGEMNANLVVTFGAYMLGLLQQEAISSKQKLRKMGAPTFKAPRGLKNARFGKNPPTFIHDPGSAQTIGRVYARILEGTPISEVEEYAFLAGLRNRSGGRLSRQSFYALLRNPVYAGFLPPGPEGGYRRPGNWEPIVSEEEFDRVQQILDGRAVPVGTQRQRANPCFPLARVVKCPVCGSKVSGYTMKGHRYYRCQKSSQHLHERAENIEMEFEGTIGRIELAEDARSTMEMERSKRMQAQTDEIRCREQRERQLLISIDNMKEAIRSGRREVNTILDIIEDNSQAIELNRRRLIFLSGCQLDADEVLDEGMRLVERPGIAWNEASPEMRLKLAPALFPGGLTYSQQKGLLYPELELAPIFRMVSDVEDGSSGSPQAEPENQAQSSTAGFRQGIRLKRA